MTSVRICRMQRGRRRSATDHLVVEEPLELRVRGESIAVIMRTPGCDEELATGFLVSEGLIRNPADVIEVARCRLGETGLDGNIVNVFLAPSVELNLAGLQRRFFASSSCGLCGKGTIESIHCHFPPVESTFRIRQADLLKLPDQLRGGQVTFQRTGGLHAAAIFDESGRLLVMREDVGRHNAVDKVIGYGFRHAALPFDRHLLLVSGRASFEIMQKALAARIAVVAAVSAPSSLAVDFARASGQTLIGFLRGDGFNIYANARRVTRH